MGVASRYSADSSRRWYQARVLEPLPLLLIAGVAFVTTAIWVRTIHTFSVMPDELGYVKQALVIARTGLLVSPHAFYFNSWGQLLPLLSAPIFGGLGMVDAYYAAHTLYALLLASTAVPAFLIARELHLGRLAAYLVAALSVTVPWMVLAGLVMTEDVAYPVFAWAILAIVRAMHLPSARRDVIALAAVGLAFFARTQFLVLGPILLLSCVIHDLSLSISARGPGGARAAVRAGLRQTVDRHRVLWVVSGLTAIGVLVVAVTGSAQSVLGNYVTPARGNLLPAGTLSAGLEQLDGVALGIGVVPLVLTATWALATLVSPHDPARHAFATVLIVTVPVFVLTVGSFQQRFLDGATTDRYLFYLVPLLFVGTAAWVVDRRGSLWGLVVVTAATAWMVLAKGLHYSDSFSILNPSFNFHRVLVGRASDLGTALGIRGLDARVPIVVVTSGLVLLAVAVSDRCRRPLALLLVTLPLLAYGGLSTGYSMTHLTSEYAGIPASHPQSLTWIDRAVPGNGVVGLVLAPSGPVENTMYTWWQPSFWNKTVQHAFVLPGGSSLAQGFVSTLTPDLANGRLDGLDGVGYLVKLKSDVRFGLRAPVVAATGDLALYRLRAGAQLRYGTQGVDENNALVADAHPLIRIFGARGEATIERVSLTVQVIGPESGCPCRLFTGPRDTGARLETATAQVDPMVHLARTLRLPPAGGHVDLPLSVRGPGGRPAESGLLLVSVQIR